MGPFDNDDNTFFQGSSGDFTLPNYDTSSSDSSGSGFNINLGGLGDKLKDGINKFTGSLEPVKMEHTASDQTMLLIGLAVLCLIMNKK